MGTETESEGRAPTRARVTLEGQLDLGQLAGLLEKAIAASVSGSIRKAMEEVDLSAPRQGREALNRGLELPEDEQEKAVCALTSRRLGPKIEKGQGMLSVRELSRFLNLSTRSLYKLLAQDAIPQPVSIGQRIRRWPLEEMLAWVFHGCAPGEKWRKIRTSAIRDYRQSFRG